MKILKMIFKILSWIGGGFVSPPVRLLAEKYARNKGNKDV